MEVGVSKELKDEFTKEFFENAKAGGCSVDGVIFNANKKDFYIEWLEKKLLSKPQPTIADHYNAIKFLCDLNCITCPIYDHTYSMCTVAYNRSDTKPKNWTPLPTKEVPV